MYKMMMKQQKVIVEENISNLSSVASGDNIHANSCSENKDQENGSSYHPNYFANPPPSQSQPLLKKKRNLPGNPDPEAEVISLSPTTLMATNRFVCEICNKGFQRDQNLQLHRRGHNLPWKLKQRNKNEIVRKKVYVCPEVNCVHHEASRALGDLTGIKKHFSRKHGEKKWKCDKCSKRYAVQSDWKAHSKTCGTREYKCDCGTLFSRRDSFITHRAFCDALAEESARAFTGLDPSGQIATHLLDPVHNSSSSSFMKKEETLFPSWLLQTQSQDCNPNPRPNSGPNLIAYHPPTPPPPSAYMSATALLQKAAQMGCTSHLTIGTSLQAPCTTSFQSSHQQYPTHVSDCTSGSSTLPDDIACVGGPHLPTLPLSLPLPLPHPYPMSLSMIMMMNQDSFADVSTFEDDFTQILDEKKLQEEKNDSKNGIGSKGNEGMTRDFLGVDSVNRSLKGCDSGLGLSTEKLGVNR